MPINNKNIVGMTKNISDGSCNATALQTCTWWCYTTPTSTKSMPNCRQTLMTGPADVWNDKKTTLSNFRTRPNQRWATADKNAYANLDRICPANSTKPCITLSAMTMNDPTIRLCVWEIDGYVLTRTYISRESVMTEKKRSERRSLHKDWNLPYKKILQQTIYDLMSTQRDSAWIDVKR